jgi:hypothetical protein
MAIRELLYAIDCDICGTRFGTGENQFQLQYEAEAAGWWFRRRADGQIAKRGGKDYCPSCAPSSWGGGAS